MFDVHGNTITFEGQDVATIDKGWPSLRAAVAMWLRDWRDPDVAYEDGHCAGYGEAERDSKEAIAQLENENEALRDHIRDLECDLESAASRVDHPVAGQGS